MKLVIASLNYSSWSVRAFLALDHSGASFTTHEIKLKVDPDWKEQILRFSGAGNVPILVDGSLSVHEALAICEYVAELHPEAKLWPDDIALRARARAICCEMASSFAAVRNEMPMNVRARTTRYVPSEAAEREVARVFDIWEASLESSGGPFLFGRFGIADCMYAPMLARFRTYGVDLSASAARYAEAMWEQPSVAKWAALAQDATTISVYDEMVP
jgi:glutathione S-transferase